MKKYKGKMDKECIPLCDAINELPGISTIESCCGHNEKPFNIWFITDALKYLPALLYWFDSCHTFPGWSVCVTTDCGMSSVKFRIEGGIGKYGESEIIAENLRLQIEHDAIEAGATAKGKVRYLTDDYAIKVLERYIEEGNRRTVPISLVKPLIKKLRYYHARNSDYLETIVHVVNHYEAGATDTDAKS